MELSTIFESLIRTPSPSFREGAVAEWIRRFCCELDYQVEEDDAGKAIGGESGNLRVRVPANAAGPTVLVCSHMDTVETGEAPIEFAQADGVYRSRADTILGADNKCGCACLLALLQHLRQNPEQPHGELSVVFTACEEVGLQGSRHVERGWLEGIDAAFALDHSYPHEIVNARAGKRAFEISITGIPGHAAGPEGRVNAAHLMAKAMARLPSGRLDEQSTCNLGFLHSGHAVNVIPGEARAKYELRSHDGDLLERHIERMQATVRDTVANEAGVEGAGCTLTEISSYPPLYEDADSPAVRLARRAIVAAGLEPELVDSGGGCDGNWISHYGVPCVSFGTGQHGAHAHSEHASLEEMHMCVRVLRELVRSETS